MPALIPLALTRRSGEPLLKYLVDTNVLSELGRKTPNANVAGYVDTLPKDRLYISVITLGEIIKGIEKAGDLSRKKQLTDWYGRIRRFFDRRILVIDEGIMTVWGAMVGSCRRTLPALDSLLAATCMHAQCSLLTRNEMDFDDIPNIVIINPWNWKRSLSPQSE
jgi:predicted nucleic acid-binding protein